MQFSLVLILMGGLQADKMSPCKGFVLHDGKKQGKAVCAATNDCRFLSERGLSIVAGIEQTDEAVVRKLLEAQRSRFCQGLQ